MINSDSRSFGASVGLSGDRGGVGGGGVLPGSTGTLPASESSRLPGSWGGGGGGGGGVLVMFLYSLAEGRLLGNKALPFG